MMSGEDAGSQLFVLLGEYSGEADDELRARHVAWLVPKFAAGVFVVSGGLDAVPGRPASALAILRARDRDHALDILADEPFHLAGIIAHDVIPFHPRVRATGLDHVFDVPGLLRTVAPDAE
jgi:uncharacterized protein YciI